MTACLCLQFTKLAVCCGLLLSLVHLVCTKEDKPTNLFEAFFPCLPGPRISTQEDAQSCDLFIYAAVQLALERVNQSNINLHSTVTRNSIGYADSSKQVVEVLYNLYVQINRLGKDFSKGIKATKAAIGTNGNYVVGRQVVSLTRNVGVPIVSYGLTDNRLNEFSNFYRTLPSIDALNWARIKLLDEFNWYRIGVLSSPGSTASHQIENFRECFGAFVERFNIEAELAIERRTIDLSSALLDLRKFDLRIILGFFGPEESRLVLCEASNYSLTTPDHVWILPSYYNPDWWKGGGDGYHSDQQTRNCTDEEMMDILNSVIFIDPVKYPPMDATMSEFFPALLNKTRELFSELDPEVPLERLLQHSRAVSAYDSTLLLALSLSDGEINRTRLDHLIACELCRKLRTDLLSREEFQFCKNITVNCSVGPETTIPRPTLLSSYGQVLISQFVNGAHCPMALYWPINTTIPQDQDKNFFRINDLCNQTCAQGVGLDFQTNITCPQNFFWKGRKSPPTSNHLLTSEVPEPALIFVGVWSVLCEVYIIFLIVFSLVWRENKNVRPTSPRINVLILMGTALTLPVPVIYGITTSGTRYNLENPFATVLCQFGLWLSWIGESLAIVGLLVKIYRLYRIFRNKQLKIRKRLEDKYLFMSAFALLIPVVFVLIVWNAVSLYRFMSVLIPKNANLQLVNVTSCQSDNEVIDDVFSPVLKNYYGIVFLTTIALSLITSKTPRIIKLDLVVTRIALGLGTVIVITIFTIEAVTVNHPNVNHPSIDELLWWGRVVQHTFGHVLIVSVLFLYQVVLVMRDYMSSKRSGNYEMNQAIDHQQKSSKLN